MEIWLLLIIMQIREMEPMFREQVMPYLEKRSQQVLRSHCVYFFGIGESALEQQLRERMI